MNKHNLKWLVPAFVLIALASVFAQQPATASVSVGHKVPNFTSSDAITNDSVSLESLLSTNKAVVLIFVSTTCPYSNGYNARMQDLSTKYGPEGVAVVGINSNATETDQQVTEHKWEHHLTFQILKDENNVVADKLGASHTPEAYLIDSSGTLVYHGRIDDNLEVADVKSHDLANAIDAVLNGKAVITSQTKAFGCSIKRVGM